MFQKSLEGQKWSFSKKFWGPLGYVLASSLVSKRWSKNQKSWPKIKKIKCFSEAPESYLKSFRPKIKFRALFSHRFMHFFIFHIFRIFSLHRAPLGPYHHFLILGGVGLHLLLLFSPQVQSALDFYLHVSMYSHSMLIALELNKK